MVCSCEVKNNDVWPPRQGTTAQSSALDEALIPLTMTRRSLKKRTTRTIRATPHGEQQRRIKAHRISIDIIPCATKAFVRFWWDVGLVHSCTVYVLSSWSKDGQSFCHLGAHLRINLMMPCQPSNATSAPCAASAKLTSATLLQNGTTTWPSLI